MLSQLKCGRYEDNPGAEVVGEAAVVVVVVVVDVVGGGGGVVLTMIALG